MNGLGLAAILLLTLLFTGYALAGSPETPEEVERRG